VFEIEDIEKYPVYEEGKKIRNSALFEKGTNVNFFEVVANNHIKVRTYERGVENETLSCGTGVTATALAVAMKYHWKNEVIIQTLGGQLAVQFNDDFSSVFLCGKVEKIFTGEIVNL
jgi:diaminopimelate epimerase